MLAFAVFITHLCFPPYERLFHAIQSNQLLAVRAALLTGSSPDGCDYSASSKDGEPEPPLVAAILKKNAAVVRALLNDGANPNFTFAEGVTPLGLALYQSSPDVVRLLLQHGADPLASDAEGRTTVDAASAGGRASMVPIVTRYLDSTDPTWRTKTPHALPRSCVYLPKSETTS